MFREEYTKRRVDIYIKNKEIKWHEADQYLMTQEDHVAARLRNEENRKYNEQRHMLLEQERVKELVHRKREEDKKELEKRISNGDTLTEDENRVLIDDPDKYLQHIKIKDESLSDVTKMIKESIENNEHPNEVLCNCHNEWTSTLKLQKACSKRIDSKLREAIEQSTSVSTLSMKTLRLELEYGEKYSVKNFSRKKKESSSQISCSMDMFWNIDRNCSQKYRTVRSLQSLRQQRLSNLLKLLKRGKDFEECHQSLLDVRSRLRVEKFATRGERRVFVEKAAALEKTLETIEQSIITGCLDICEKGRTEKMHFLNLFCVCVETNVATSSESSTSALKTKKKVPGYMQKKKSSGPIVVSKPNKRDNDRKKLEVSPITGEIIEVIDEGGDSEADDDVYPCPQACTISPAGEDQIKVAEACPQLPPFFIIHTHQKRAEDEQKKANTKKKEEENKMYEKYLNDHDQNKTAQVSPPPSRRIKSRASKRLSMQPNVADHDLKGSTVKETRRSMTMKAEDYEITKNLLQDLKDQNMENVVPKEGSRVIPGLSKFSHPDTHRYLAMIRILEVKQWSKRISSWYYNVEIEWKKKKSTLCLLFMQRARLLLSGGQKHKQLRDDDASLAMLLRRANAFDLIELLCCRSNLIIRVCG